MTPRLSAAPWWAKVVGRIAIAYTPGARSVARQLGLNRFGEMLDPQYALGVFRAHFARASARASLDSGFACLELGPGDSALSVLVARAHGAGSIWLCDVGRFASQSIAVYARAVASLARLGFPGPGLERASRLPPPAPHAEYQGPPPASPGLNGHLGVGKERAGAPRPVRRGGSTWP